MSVVEFYEIRTEPHPRHGFAAFVYRNDEQLEMALQYGKHSAMAVLRCLAMAEGKELPAGTYVHLNWCEEPDWNVSVVVSGIEPEVA